MNNHLKLIVTRRKFLLSSIIVLQSFANVKISNSFENHETAPRIRPNLLGANNSFIEAFHYHDLYNASGKNCCNSFSLNNQNKSWKEQEKKIIDAHIKEIERLFPVFSNNLMQCAAICLCRNSEFKTMPTDENVACSATARYRVVTLGDRFFKKNSKNQLRTLIHEFLHIMDEGGIFSYRDDWIAFAAPFILESPNFESLTVGPDRLYRDRNIPGCSAVLSLGETLAEFGSAALLNEDFDDRNRVDKFFRSTILAKEPESFIRYYRKGVNSFVNSDYKTALSQLDSAVLLSNGNPGPIYFQALCFWKLKDFGKALNASLNFSQKMSGVRANVTPIDQRDLSMLKMRTLCQAKLGLINDSLATIEEITNKQPSNSFAQRLKKILQNKSSR